MGSTVGNYKVDGREKLFFPVLAVGITGDCALCSSFGITSHGDGVVSDQRQQWCLQGSTLSVDHGL